MLTTQKNIKINTILEDKQIKDGILLLLFLENQNLSLMNIEV